MNGLGVKEGGKYSLAEVLREQLRRGAQKGEIDLDRIFDVLCRLSAASDDGLVTYGKLWQELFPDRPWMGNHSQQLIGRALGGIIYRCVTNDLPIMTVLVVNKGIGDQSPKAVENIYNECKGAGA